MKHTSSVLQEINAFAGPSKQDRQKVILDQLEGFSDVEKHLFLPAFLSIGAEILEECKNCIAKAKMTELNM